MRNDAKAAAAKPCAQKYQPVLIALEGDEAGRIEALEGDEAGHALTLSGDAAEVSTDGQ